MGLGKIIVVEGISNSGKTTLCRYLEAKSEFRVVPESIRYLENRLETNGDSILKIPETLSEELLNQDILFDVEFEKMYDANFIANQGINVVIDKSALSIIATAYAFSKIGIVSNSYEAARQRYSEMIQKMRHHNLQFPDYHFLLTANHDESMARNKQRKHKLAPVWTSGPIRSNQQHALETEFTKLDGKSLILDTTKLSYLEVYERIINEIQK